MMRRDSHGARASEDVGARDGRGRVVADDAVGGGRAEACHCGRGHVTALEDVASIKMAVQTFASDVAADEAAKEGGGRGCYCGRGHGTTAEVVASVGVASRDGLGACHTERIRLLDATAASDAAGRAV